MLTRGFAGIFLLLAIVALTGCAGNKTSLAVEISKGSCSGLSFVDASGEKSDQQTKEIPAGNLEINVVNKGSERTLILVVAKELPTVVQYLGFTDGFQPVVDLDALTKDHLLVTKSIGKEASATIGVKLQSGSYWLLDPERIFCEEVLALNVVP
jgi:hypothetical protein